MTRYLVTSALPYANGPIHFGHAVGAYLPADLYVRTLRMQGEDVAFICGTDEYGVAITIGAEKADQAYPEYVSKWHDVIENTLTQLGVEFDIFSGTSSCELHAETAQEFFRDLDSRGFLVQRESEQLFCTTDSLFLADRYVQGECPDCGFMEARGDECPQCGSWLDALKLLSPACKICGGPPERRSTKHWYLDMPKLRDEFIGSWIDEHEWKPNVRAFIKNLLSDVPQRAITRDMSWGIPVPPDLAGEAEGKVLYVWFDAPIGYVSFTKEWCASKGDPDLWRTYWQDEDSRLVHFIGKDNIPFHCMVFPSMLHGTGRDWVLPWHVPANEFYNLEGKKFNTSTGHYIDLDSFFTDYDAEVARFHLFASMPETADSDWSWREFQSTANSSLVGTIGNLVTRVLKFIVKNYDGKIPALVPAHAEELDRVLFSDCGEVDDPGAHVRAFRFRRAAETLVANASIANVFVDRMAPWALRKTDPELAGSALNTLCEWIALLARWSAPFLPTKAQAMWEMVGGKGRVVEAGWPAVPTAGTWRSLQAGTPLGEVRGLFDRIADEAVEAELAKLNTPSES